MEEYFDVLDSNGNKTGKVKLRKEVHRDGDWHKGAHIWLINEKGEILLQKRSAKKESHPNMLSISCAGHLSAGDDSITGALREIKEELGLIINPKDLKFIKTIKTPAKNSLGFVNNEFNDMYILKTSLPLSAMHFDEEEVSGLYFVTYKDFKDMVATNSKELVRFEEEFNILFALFDNEFSATTQTEK
ncbi:MAG: NUDIX domain-containing protein [Spirochaetales bacterium]